MRIEYECTVDDLVYFGEYHWRHSPAMQKQYRQGMWPGPLLGLALGYLIGGVRRPWAFAVIALVVAVAYHLFYVRCVSGSLKKGIGRVHAEGKNRGVVGSHSIEISREGLREKTEVNHTMHAWRGVERIETDDEYIFIYTQAMMAHVIPRRSFPDKAAAEEFVHEARALHAGAA